MTGVSSRANSPVTAPRGRFARPREYPRAVTSDSPARADAAPSRRGRRAVRPTERRRLPDDVAAQLLDLVASSTGSEVALPADARSASNWGEPQRPARGARRARSGGGHRDPGQVGIAHVGQGRARARRAARDRRGHDDDLVLDPMEVRRILEPEVASLAAKRASRAAIDEMER